MKQVAVMGEEMGLVTVARCLLLAMAREGRGGRGKEEGKMRELG